MEFLSQLSALVEQGYGWLVLLGWLIWQGFATKHISGHVPMFSPLLSAGERLDTLENNQKELIDRIDELDEMQVHHIQATRANSRALDETKDVSVDADKIDDYLVDNGVPVTQFIIERNSVSHSD